MREKQDQQVIENKTYPQERALYHLQDALVRGCRFEGEEDGESAFKEGRRLRVENCLFALRYPLWHVHGLHLAASEMTETCRAALWYDSDVTIEDCAMHGIKALRECEDVTLRRVEVSSPEFGWNTKRVRVEESELAGDYMFFGAGGLELTDVEQSGKYSFQYVRNLRAAHCKFDTKDAFWHSKNVTVTDSVVKGEYLGWYSENLTFIRCRIIGTQPLCYCKNLRLIDCTTEGCDLAFEYSTVHAEIRGAVLSVKNPRGGKIVADGFGEIIEGDNVYPVKAKLIARGKQRVHTARRP